MKLRARDKKEHRLQSYTVIVKNDSLKTWEVITRNNIQKTKEIKLTLLNQMSKEKYNFERLATNHVH